MTNKMSVGVVQGVELETWNGLPVNLELNQELLKYDWRGKHKKAGAANTLETAIEKSKYLDGGRYLWTDGRQVYAWFLDYTKYPIAQDLKEEIKTNTFQFSLW